MEKLPLKVLKNLVLNKPSMNNISINSQSIKKVLIGGILVFSTFTANAQMDCRSMLGAHLTPVTENSNISWGVEGTVAPGIMTSPYENGKSTTIGGGMLIGAMDFSFLNNHSFYVEGGYKNWTNSEFVESTKSNRPVGMRQAFYSFTNTNTKIKFGLHESRLGNFIMLDDRIMGLSINQNIGAFTVDASVGSVSSSFTRMGKFCANRHIYGVLSPNYTENIGTKIGETNLAGVVINWNPNFVKAEVSGVEEASEFDDEFASTDEFNNNDEFHENHDFNEFGSNDEFSEDNVTELKQKSSFISVKNIGLIFYSEFGNESYIPDSKLYTGFIADINLPFNIFMQASSIYQNMQNNNSFVYIAKIGKSKIWENASNTKLSGAYIGKVNIDDNALFQPLFSNLFIGEIMRMDATEFPLWQVALKHRFPGKLKMHVAVKAVAQTDNNKTNEQDIEFGLMAFKNHIKLTLIGSRVETLALPEDFYMARLEMRVAF